MGGRGRASVPQETPRPRRVPSGSPASRARLGRCAECGQHGLCSGWGRVLASVCTWYGERGFAGSAVPLTGRPRGPLLGPLSIHHPRPPHRLLGCVTVIVSLTPHFLPRAHRSRAACPQTARVASSASELSNSAARKLPWLSWSTCHRSRRRLRHQPRSAVRPASGRLAFAGEKARREGRAGTPSDLAGRAAGAVSFGTVSGEAGRPRVAAARPGPPRGQTSEAAGESTSHRRPPRLRVGSEWHLGHRLGTVLRPGVTSGLPMSRQM